MLGPRTDDPCVQDGVVVYSSSEFRIEEPQRAQADRPTRRQRPEWWEPPYTSNSASSTGTFVVLTIAAAVDTVIATYVSFITKGRNIWVSYR